MARTISTITTTGESYKLTVDKTPDRCPHCKKYCTAKILTAVRGETYFGARQDVVTVCQCDKCDKIFIAAYAITIEGLEERGNLMSHKLLEYTSRTEFSETVMKLSPIFCETYHQSARAEENRLSQICGAGYRRALEFLVKDFAISKVGKSDDKERNKIERMALNQCISEYLPSQIKDAAVRAAWLGNDETHYYRAWTDQDVNDLKRLIQLTVKSLDFTIELEHYIAAMPDTRKKNEGKSKIIS